MPPKSLFRIIKIEGFILLRVRVLKMRNKLGMKDTIMDPLRDLDLIVTGTASSPPQSMIEGIPKISIL